MTCKVKGCKRVGKYTANKITVCKKHWTEWFNFKRIIYKRKNKIVTYEK
jgi:hypothetical protein